MRCLKSNNNTLIRKALPRMLTLWFSFTAFRDDSSNNNSNNNNNNNNNSNNNNSNNSNNSNNNNNNNNNNVENQRRNVSTANNTTNNNLNYIHTLQQKLIIFQKEVNSNVEKSGVGDNKRVQSYAWFHCLPQLVSRLGHYDKFTVTIISNIIKETLIAYPRHSIWHIACLLKSDNKHLVILGKKFVSEACEILQKKEKYIESDMLKSSLILFDKMATLAKLSVPEKDKKIKYDWSKVTTTTNNNNNTELDLTQFLVPNQHTLLTPPTDADLTFNQSSSSSSQNRDDSLSLSHTIIKSTSDTFLYIQKFHDNVEVATSKARPKIIKLTTTSGKEVKFLLKQEKNGDLRKDARMMEFNATINRILLEGL
jgi:hypothetical protein